MQFRLKKRVVAASLMTTLAVSGCVLPPSKKYAYYCPDGYEFTIRYTGAADPGDIATLNEPSGSTKLPRTPSASGARYSNGVTVFWSQGDEALLQQDAEIRHTGCTTDPDQHTPAST